MGMGSLTLACLLLTATAGAEPEVSYLPGLKMAIPITIDPKKRDDIRDLALFCSKDEGKQWDQVSHAAPDKDSFPFTAKGDGKYWFLIQITYKNNTKEPADLLGSVPGQKIIVDTTKPQVTLKAERKGDDIQVSWQVAEENPNPSTFVVEYHIEGQPVAIWIPAPALPSPVGATTIKPAPTGAVSVRLRVKDMAENEGSSVVEVAAATANQPLPLPLPTPVNNPTWPPPVNNQQVLGTTQPSAPVGPLPVAPPMRGALPPKQLINKPEARLDFDVNKLGPSGFGTVEVYVTTDEGTSWNQVPLDAALIQPPEMRGVGQAHGSVQVKVPEDGKVFGYYLVVKSRANLGKPRPNSGDLPHIRLERDTVCPAATLIDAKPDQNRQDTVILRWKAEDKNLTDRPISLEWAPQPDGPWTYIGPAELPNTGSYAWQVPPTAPPSVYFKLTVRDGAGNVSVAQSSVATVVDMCIPEIAGVSLSPVAH